MRIAALCPVIVAIWAACALGQTKVEFGLGAGGVLNGFVGGHGTEALGSSLCGFVELPAKRERAVRLEIAWIDMGFSVRQEIPYTTPNGFPSTRRDVAALRVVGGGLDFIWFETGSWGKSYFMVGAGGYVTTEAQDSVVLVLLGPGFGARTSGAIALGVEAALRFAVVRDGTTLVFPVKIYMTF